MPYNFDKRTWVDRKVQYPGRRVITNIEDATDTQIVDVERDTSSISSAGYNFSAAKMNDLENRIEAALTSVQTALNTRIKNLYPVGFIWISSKNESPQTKYSAAGWTWAQITDAKIMVAVQSIVSRTVGNAGTVQTFTPTGAAALWGSIQSALADLPVHVHYYNEKYTRNITYDLPQPGYEWYRWDVRGSDPVAVVTRETTAYGGNQPHPHDFGPIYASLQGRQFSIDITQPYTTIYAWRRTS